MQQPGTSRLNYFFVSLAVAAALFLGSCASSKVLLNRAEESWARGAYIDAINMALDSYEKAVEKNRKPEEINAAKDFLTKRFPMADENLRKEAIRKQEGSDAEKATAWQVWNQLASMNRKVKDSRAGTFLDTQDYTKELAAAKQIAAQIRYVEALELIGQDERDAYIRAASLLGEIENTLSPGFRDVSILRNLCYDKATITIAFSNRALNFSVRKGSIGSSGDLQSMITQNLQDYIKKK